MRTIAIHNEPEKRYTMEFRNMSGTPELAGTHRNPRELTGTRGNGFGTGVPLTSLPHLGEVTTRAGLNGSLPK
jgi:hypothetical protein